MLQVDFAMDNATGTTDRPSQIWAEGTNAILEQLLKHPRMPPHLRSLFLELQAQKIGSSFWSWDSRGIIETYKVPRAPRSKTLLLACVA